MLKTARLSPCGRFRYLLGRDWSSPLALGEGHNKLLFVMLNPSTADAEIDDPTIRRCIGFAKVHGFTSLEVVNLFAFRSPSPRVLRDAGWPGADVENDTQIALGAADASGICLAWGGFASRTPRAGQVLEILQDNATVPLQCLGTTADGHPAHPLYLPTATRLRAFHADGVPA